MAGFYGQKMIFANPHPSLISRIKNEDQWAEN
jgi:hypothetical protein